MNWFKNLLHLSIGIKLAVTFFMVILLSSLPLTVVMVNFGENILFETTEEAIKNFLEIEESNIAEFLVKKDEKRLMDISQSIIAQRFIKEVAFLDEKGYALTYTSKDIVPFGLSRLLEDKRHIVKHKVTDKEGNPVGFVIIRLDKKEITRQFSYIKYSVLGISSGFGLVGILLSLIISYRINSRLRRILKEAEKVRKGHIEEVNKIDFPEKDEIQDLADVVYEAFKNVNTFLNNIRFAQDFYAEIVNNVYDIVLILDREMRIFFTNHRIETLGFNYHQLLGRRFSVLIKDPRDRTILRNTLNNKLPFTYETEIRKKKGGSIPSLLSIMPAKEWYIVTIADISKIKELENKMKRIEALSFLGEMSANLAHELKNALLPVKLLTSMDECDKKDIEIIKKSISRIDGIVNEFLTFAKIGGGNWSLLNISEVIKENISLLLPRIKEKNIELKTFFEDIHIYSNREALNAILTNLLNNAIEAIDGKGFIHVSAVRKNMEVHITISDSGKGIPKENMDKIFSPFFTTKKGGTGLGLPIVMRYTHLLGGTLDIHSQVGKGTTITVTIPYINNKSHEGKGTGIR